MEKSYKVVQFISPSRV